MPPVPLLIVSGPVGVGKTVVAEEVSDVLNARRVAHSLIDLDVLAETYPRPPDDPFNVRLALENLRDVWVNCAAAGAHNLVVARVVETQGDADGIQSAVPGAKPTVCQLSASDATLIQRVRRRELGSGREWHEARALELAAQLRESAPADLVVETEGRSLSEIAAEIVERVDWARGE